METENLPNLADIFSIVSHTVLDAIGNNYEKHSEFTLMQFKKKKKLSLMIFDFMTIRIFRDFVTQRNSV